MNQDIFDRISNVTVLVVGDVMIDAYAWSRVDRISPEAPVPVAHVVKRENRLGGAANVALNVQALGAKAIICSVIGDDSNGDVLRSTLKSGGFSTEGIIDSPGRCTTVKTRIIAQGHHLLRMDEENTHNLSPTDERHLLDCIRRVLDKHSIGAIVFEDYNKGVITRRVIDEVISMAKGRGIITCVDPKKENFLNYKGVDLFKPNLKELREGLHVNIVKDDLDSVRHGISELQKNLECKYVMTTLSEKGVMVFDGNEYTHIPAHRREIVDVSGAGDTVIALAAVLLAAECNIVQAARIANLAGGLVCEMTGVVPVSLEKLKKEMISLEAGLSE
jgi:rfaE bifunctional protein kinase chain/domain